MTTVTRTTKLLALAMFILLPIWAFYIGFKLGEGIEFLRIVNIFNGQNLSDNTLVVRGQKMVKNPVHTTLPVKILYTKMGIPQGEQSFKYPDTVSVSVPQKYMNEVTAYGASYDFVIAPSGWTGSGLIAADGNISVDLTSQGGVWGKGSKIDVYIASTGTNNALYGAAPYFPWVRNHWYELTDVKIPGSADMKSSVLTPKLIKYQLNDPPDGYEVSGVAYSDAAEHEKDQYWSFMQMEITYPVDQSSFANSLLNTFIDQHGLTK